MESTIHERPGLRDISGYVPGEQPAGGVKLNTNENPYPPSPAVAEALARFPVERLRRYPPASADPFRAAAARLHGLDPSEIVATNGGDELLRLAIATYVEPGEPVAIAPPTYSLYSVLIRLHGAHPVELPLTEDWAFPERFAERLNRSGARLALLVNPHAPSGRLFDRETVEAVADEFDGVLLVDEAYVDFVDPGLGYDLVPAIRDHPNLVILRTLSKGYSLAGLRFGYGLGSASLLDPMATKTKDSYNVDTLAVEVARAAIESREWAADNWTKVRTERERLRAGLERLGLTTLPSETNFVLAAVPPDAAVAGTDADRGMPRGVGESGADTASGGADDTRANALYLALKARDVHVRWFAEPRLADRLRISVGTPEEDDRLLAVLAELLSTPLAGLTGKPGGEWAAAGAIGMSKVANRKAVDGSNVQDERTFSGIVPELNEAAER